ncbi:hypothetical protein CYY_001748 [Polysphondylium violaceum]|uniref:Uncharacterized protein n=1 Tax=Polysphondylium violaceum TaxID=133409 RepID=A0A8J4Q1F9_9MYCE|nr:hypothetical protein CYY_001748 [Polysphondylium violaceum]
MLGRKTTCSLYRQGKSVTTLCRPFIVNRFYSTRGNSNSNDKYSSLGPSSKRSHHSSDKNVHPMDKYTHHMDKKVHPMDRISNNKRNEQHQHQHNQKHQQPQLIFDHHKQQQQQKQQEYHPQKIADKVQLKPKNNFDVDLKTFKALMGQLEKVLKNEKTDSAKLKEIEKKLVGDKKSLDKEKESSSELESKKEHLSSSFISRSYLESDLHPVYYSQGHYRNIKDNVELIHDFKPVDFETGLEIVEKYNYSNIPKLSHGLEKVLTERGVHPIVNFDGTKNFPGFLTDILEFKTLEIPTNYTPPSKDKRLLTHAVNEKSRFISSTSSITAVLTQFYLALTKKKGVNLYGFSDSLLDLDDNTFIPSITKPASVHLIPLGNGIWGIDVNNGNYIQQHTTLMELGHSMERMLTMSEGEFNEKLLKVNNPDGPVTLPESYIFSKFKSLMYRSQIDCYSDVVGGTFDLKTRATHSIRMNSSDIPNHVSYQLKKISGEFSSYEREYYDLVKSGAIKYNFQAKIGAMAGIFVAYHNTKRIFGAEYIPVEELDRSVFWGTDMADKTFKIINNMLDEVLNLLVDDFDPTFTYRLTFSGGKSHRSLSIFVEKLVSNQPADPLNSIDFYEIEFQVLVNDKDIQSPLHFTPTDKLEVYYRLVKHKTKDVITPYTTVLKNAKIYQEFSK